MKVPVGLVLLLCALPARADTWAHDFGGINADHPRTILETGDGGFLVAGDASFDAHFSQPCPCQYWHLWLTRVDASGHRLWDALYQEGGYAYASGAAARPDGGWMLAGRRFTLGTPASVPRPFLLATDASGALLHAREVGTETDSLRSIVSTSDGRFVTVGTTSTSNVSETWVMKVAAAGDIVWSHRYGTHSSDVPGPRRFANGIAAEPTADGGVLIGEVVSNDNPRKLPAYYTDTDIAVDKVDADGQVVWSSTYGGAGIEELVDLERTADGGILVLGSTQPRDVAAKAAWILRLDASGNFLWQEMVTTATAATAGVGLVASPDGTAAVLLRLDRGYPFPQGTALVRLGRLGEILWARSSLDLSPTSALARASNGDFVLGLSVAEDMRVVRVEDDPASDCSGLVEDLGFVRTATAEASTARRVSRHAYAPVVSTPPVSVQEPVADLGAVCP